MANKGLKEYTKQISQTVGDVAKVFVNVNKADANMHIVIPLLTTLGPNPIDLSLIWNYQDKDRMGYFGKGCNINLFKEYSDIESYILVRDADGSYLTYDFDNGSNLFTSKENAISIQKNTILIPGDSDEYTYHFKDLQGNIVRYDNGNDYYPTSIEYANGEKTIFNGLNMDNKRGAKVNFTETNEIITKVSYIQDGTLLYSIDFGYDSNKRMTSVKHYKESKLIKHLSIAYTDTEIKVKDEINHILISYTISNDRITSITKIINGQSTSQRSTTISYEDRRTKLVNQEGFYSYVYFDTNNIPLFIIDQEGNVRKSKFDINTKRLISLSPVIPTKNKLPNLSNITIADFVKTGNISTTISSVNDSVLAPNIGKVYCVSGTGSLSYTIYTSGLAKDNLMLVLWGKQNSNYSESSNVKVSLRADGSKIDYFHKPSVDTNFDLMTLGISATKSYSLITIKITLTGNASIDIGGMQILKKNYGVFYSYDNNGKVTNIETGSGSISSLYDNKGQKTAFLGLDSAFYEYEYDTNGNIISAKTAFGTKIEKTYDSYNKPIKYVVTNGKDNKKLEVTRTYQNGKYITSEQDTLGNETKYFYDTFGKIKKVIDAINATTEYSYDAYDNLTSILFNSDTKIIYKYDLQNKLTLATLPNGLSYSFGYDSCNNLNSISMNGTQIVTFEYNLVTGLIEKQTFGLSGDIFEFVYDNLKLNIKEVYCNGNLKYKYSYDVYNRLVKITNENNNILKQFEYDINGKVIQVKENESCINYEYDSFSNISQTKKTIRSKSIYESFDNISKSKGFNPEAIKALLQNNLNYVGSLFDKDISIKNSKYNIKAEMYNGSILNKICTRDGYVPCVLADSSTTMSYALPMKNAYPLDSGCVAFWFKPTSNGTKYLFSVKAKNRYDFIGVYINTSGSLVLEVTDYKNVNHTLITTTGKVKLNEWNFFGLSFMNRDDGQGYKDICVYALFLNTETRTYKKENPRLIVEPNTGNYHIGYKYNGTSATYGLNSYITALIIGCKSYMRIDEMNKYYRHTKDYIFGLNYLKGDAVNYSSSTFYDISDSMLQQFNIFPLHNNLKSLKDTLPVAYDLRSVTSLDKDRTFQYNQAIKRFAYVADEGRLEYCLDTSEVGTIIMKAFISEDTEKQYILECQDIGEQRIGLYRGIDKYLNIEVNGVSIKTTLVFSSNVWHTVGLSFKDDLGTSGSIVNGPFVTVRAYLDGNVYSVDQHIPQTFDMFYFSLGRKFESVLVDGKDLGNYNTYYPLLGQIEMLATRSAFCEVSTLNVLSNELKISTKTSEYDEFDRIKKTIVYYKNKDILTNTYSYKMKNQASNNTSLQVEKETIVYRTGMTERSYKLDNLGNVTAINDLLFDSHTYTYNERGFLVKEDEKSFIYDSNGNITKAGTAIFTYDSIIKDRLKTVNGKEIIYGSNPLNPSKYNGNTYEFEGRQLTRFNNNYYTYNNQGLRVKKIINTMPIQYYYDRDKLITEISPFYRLDFLYDEYDELYGLIFNETKKYFYIKDHLQNILGIVDTDGILVVKYSCDAWGNHKVLDGNGNLNTDYNFIGNLNPFRYKGYYYDTESNMYYCKSRYYVPEWCRWLNADSIVFNFKMGFGTINGCNLFNYCFNNPTIYFDIDGLYPTETRKVYLFNIERQYKKERIQYVQFIKKNNLTPHNLPTKGIPGSVGKQVNSDGTPHREREYDENGDAKVDHDHHPEKAGYDHDHEWDWSKEKPRGPVKPVKPSTNSFSIDSDKFIAGAAGLVFACFLDQGFLGFKKFS